jgi:ABC-type branched-subunit amino acid transport system ATPase component
VSEVVLEATDVSVRFGGLLAVDAVSAAFRAGERVGIIGPNGAGKTTFFNALSGVQAVTAGRIRVGADDLTGAAAHRFARHGVARTFQTPRVFAGLSVAANVAFGGEFAGRARGAQAVRESSGGMPAAARGGPPGRAGAAPVRSSDDVAALLERLGLSAEAERPAADLTPSQQRLLEIGMALATRPRILLLDEVAAGLTEAELERTALLIRQVGADFGLAVVWIEHAVTTLLRHVDRVIVLHQGRVLADAAPADVVRDRAVIDAYLGDEMAEPA